MARKSKPLTGPILLLSLLLFGLAVGGFYWGNSKPSIPQDLMGVLRPDPKPISNFQLSDHNGKVFDTKRLQGKWSFVFFGYTFCPDICPTTLAVLTATQKQLQLDPEVWSESQVIFVSVDPDRDTQEKLASYMEFFNQEFIAITGTREEIDNLARQFNALYIIESETQPGFYLVSHTAAIFLVDPQARLVGSFSQPHYPSSINSLFRKIREYF